MNPNFHIIPFESLLEKLKGQGFLIGIEEYARIHQLLNIWDQRKQERTEVDRGESEDWDEYKELKIKLGTILCSNEEMLQVFDEQFDLCYGKPFPDGKIIKKEEKEGRTNEPKPILWLAGAGMLLFAAVGLLMFKLFKEEAIPGARGVVLPYTESLWLEDTTKEDRIWGRTLDAVASRRWKVHRWDGQYDQYLDTVNKTGVYIDLIDEVYDFNIYEELAVDSFASYVNFQLDLYKRQTNNRLDLPNAYSHLNGFRIIHRYASGKMDSSYLDVENMYQPSPLQVEIDDLSIPGRNQKVLAPSITEPPLKPPPMYSALYPIWDHWMLDSLSAYQMEEQLQWYMDSVEVEGDTLEHDIRPGTTPLVELEYQRLYIRDNGDTLRFHHRRSNTFPYITEEEEIEELIRIPEMELVDEEIPDLIKPYVDPWKNPFVLTISGLLILAGLIYEVYLWRKRKKVLDTSKNLDLPLDYELKIDRPPLNLFRSPGFEQAALLLRRQQASEAEELDVPSSLKRTVEHWGFLQLIFRPRFQGVQYLFLIQQQQVEDQSCRYFDELVAALNERDITAKAWYFEDDPMLCFKDRQRSEPEFFLYEEATTYQNYRLIIIGNVSGILDPATDRLLNKAELFKSWAYRAWMVVRPGSEWGKPEMEALKLFNVLPANEAGMETLVRIWTGEEAVNPSILTWQEGEESLPLDLMLGQSVEASVIPSLTSYLGEEGLRWLAACAVYPECYWEMTLAYGKMLGYFPANASLIQQQLSTDTLRKLLRLPWLREGKMPEPLRAHLFDYLWKNDPEFLKEVRTYLIEILEQPHQDIPQDSYARQKQKTLLAIYRYQNEGKKQQLTDDLVDAGVDEHDLEDIVSIRVLSSKEHHPLLIPLPRELYKGNIPFFGFKNHVRFLGMLGLIGFVWVLGFLYSGQKPRKPYQEKHLRTDLTIREQAKWQNYRGKIVYDSIDQKIESRVDSSDLLSRAITYFQEAWNKDSTYNKAMTNLLAARFNEACRVYAHGEIDSAAHMFVDLSNQAYVTDSIRQDILFVAGSTYLMSEHPEKAIPSFMALDSLYLHDTTLSSFYRDTLMQQGDIIVKGLQRAFLKGGDKQETTASVIRKFNGSMPAYVLIVEVSENGSQKKVEDLGFDAAYAYEPLDSGRYVFELPRMGYGSLELEIGSNDDRFMDIDTVLELREDTTRINWTMEPAQIWTIIGKIGWVVDSSVGFAGVRIEATEHGDIRRTDEEGRFSLKVKTPRAPNAFHSLWPMSLQISDRPYIKPKTVSLDSSYVTVFNADQKTYIQRNEIPILVSLDFYRTPSMYVRGGTFMMGEEDTTTFTKLAEDVRKDYRPTPEPLHPVQLDDFYMDEHEVTVGQYLYFLQEENQYHRSFLSSRVSGGYYKLSRLDHPAIYVSWYDAVAYAEWLSERRGKSYQLPTEAQWEYAAKGGHKAESTIYAGSDNLDLVAWYRDNSGGRTHPIKSKRPNELGIYDMSGNVWEWCADWYESFPPDISEISDPIYEPKGPAGGDSRVLRGGSWSDVPIYCRVAYRYYIVPVLQGYYVVGFRLLRKD